MFWTIIGVVVVGYVILCWHHRRTVERIEQDEQERIDKRNRRIAEESTAWQAEWQARYLPTYYELQELRRRERDGCSNL